VVEEEEGEGPHCGTSKVTVGRKERRRRRRRRRCTMRRRSCEG